MSLRVGTSKILQYILRWSVTFFGSQIFREDLLQDQPADMACLKIQYNKIRFFGYENFHQEGKYIFTSLFI